MRAPLAVTIAGLAALAAVVYGPHVAHGGFISDDWANADGFRHLPDAGYWSSVEGLRHAFGARPLLALLVPLPYAAFGTADPTWHLVLALAIAVITSACLFSFLRAARLPWPHAAVVAALALLFPWDSSTRLWPTVAMNNVATCLVLLGAVAALRGLARRGLVAVVWHAAATTLFVASVLVYEFPAPLVLALGPLYVARAGWRRALPRWSLDVLCVGAALAWAAANTVKYRPPILDQVEWAPRVVKGLAGLTARTAIPLGLHGTPLVLLAAVLAAGAGAALLLLRRLAPGDRGREPLRLWLAVAAGAALAALVGSLLEILSVYFEPLAPGIYNRGNIAICGPIALLAWALVMLIVTLVTRALRDRAPRLSGSVAVLAAALVLTGLAVGARRDADRWDRAAAESRRVLAAIGRLGPLPPETTIYTFGHAAQSAPGIPVFFDTWDLNGAARLVTGDPSLRAYPAYRGARFRCRASGIATSLPAPTGFLSGGAPHPFEGVPEWGPDPGARYGRTVFVDVASGTSTPIRDREQCARAARRFAPGPLQLGGT
jgi:hypothetical protein